MQIHAHLPFDEQTQPDDPPAIISPPPHPSIPSLYNVTADVTEQSDVAGLYPEILADMKDRLSALKEGFYTNDDVGVDVCPGGLDVDCACWAGANVWGGFFGPYQL